MVQSAWSDLNKRRSSAASKRQKEDAARKQAFDDAGGKFLLAEVRGSARRFEPSFGGNVIWQMRGREFVYLCDQQVFAYWFAPGVMRGATKTLWLSLHPAARKYAQEFVNDDEAVNALCRGWDGLGPMPAFAQTANPV